MNASKPHSNRIMRRGSAAVEFAVCAPILVSMVFASIETSRVLQVKNTATTVAYEVAQSVTASGGTAATAISHGNSVLAARSIHGGQVAISPTVDSHTTTGTVVTVTVTVPVNGNSYGISSYFVGKTITSRVVMEKL